MVDKSIQKLYNPTQEKALQESSSSIKLANMMSLHHNHADEILPNQCTSSLVQTIDAPLGLVWSVVRRFEKPQAYKQFVKDCTMTTGDGEVGSVREVTVVSGLPGERSTERLDRLDDDMHVMVVSFIDGDHKLVNYQSTTTLHEDDNEDHHRDHHNTMNDKTVVIESYVVDVPEDSCEADTCLFADTIVGFNLKSLAKLTERMASAVVAAA